MVVCQGVVVHCSVFLLLLVLVVWQAEAEDASS
jgi:cell division septal protein FtsQ